MPLLKDAMSKKRDYQICSRCVMDTSDPEISFNSQGVCNHCLKFDNHDKQNWHPNKIGYKKLSVIFDNIKKESTNKEYDCILGISGGVDSSYLAIKLKEFNLRVLLVHVDAGWNSEVAVSNIEKIVRHTGYDLKVVVKDWEEIKDLQNAFFRSNLANQDVVQDHAFFATLYHLAVEHNINYVINGGNMATESVFPKSWHHSAMDSISIKDVHRKHGTLKKLKDYRTISFFQYYFYYPYVKKLKHVRPLNFMPYSKEDAVSILKNRIGFKKYKNKHGESRFTKFFQNHYLPKKFNFDKRRIHLSSLILSETITRKDALMILEEPLYDEFELKEDMLFVAKKLNISYEDLENYIKGPLNYYTNYRNWDVYYGFMKFLQRSIKKYLKIELKSYS